MKVNNNMIRRFLGKDISDREFEIKQVDSLGINESTLMFSNKPSLDLEALDFSNNCIYIIDDSYSEYESTRNDFIIVSNPKYKFCLLLEEFYIPSRLQNEFLYYDRDNNLPYYDELYCKEVIIGSNCKIDKYAIIGGTDFSPVLGDDSDTILQFPQKGGILIGNNVTIKYHTMIGKGTFGFTEIGDNTMIDYGCQIGHNCKVGKSCIIAAGTIVGGSTIIGDNTVIGIGAKIRNGIKIGCNASIGMGAVVIRDVPDNSVVVGNPAHVIDHDKIFNERGLV